MDSKTAKGACWAKEEKPNQTRQEDGCPVENATKCTQEW